MSSRSSELRIALGRWQGVLRENVPLAPYTHARLGGPAPWFAEPFGEEDAAVLVRTCKELELPLYVLGGGSNLLVADAGVDGVVMTLATLNRTVRDKLVVTAQAGVTLPSLMRNTKDVGLAGLEVLAGIPAQVGGAVAMNAGTRDGATFDRLVSLSVVDPAGEIRSLKRSELAPSYRDGNLRGAIVLAATFELTPDTPAAIFARLEASLKKRNATQPVAQKSVGCAFKNPEGNAAGRLIDEAGCKLLRRGAIFVSGLHANYFVNEGGGTAADFLELMREVRRRVADRFGVALEPEVKLWGNFEG
jgi:UDP-N-acetylmuramate dehydrogenase